MLKVQIVTAFSGFKAGQIVPVKADENGKPASNFWRRRLRDADKDGCVKVLTEKQVNETIENDPTMIKARKRKEDNDKKRANAEGKKSATKPLTPSEG